ncbi:MAG: hypothetical protein WA459_23540 [Stellaceae bacterium]
MKSAEELRVEARRLRETVENISDPQLKQELATRALDLSMRAEAIADSIEHPEVLRKNIARYRAMLAAGISDPSQKNIVEEMLDDAETLLRGVRIAPKAAQTA